MFEPGYLALYRSGELKRRAEALEARLACCDICPRKCSVNRLKGELGFCHSGLCRLWIRSVSTWVRNLRYPAPEVPAQFSSAIVTCAVFTARTIRSARTGVKSSLKRWNIRLWPKNCSISRMNSAVTISTLYPHRILCRRY